MPMSKTSTFARVNSPGARAYDNADTKNAAGHAAWTRSLEERIAQSLLTGTLNNTFYASEEKVAKDVHDTLSEAAQKDPEFLAKAIIYARNEGCMRLMPIVGLTYLSRESPEHFRRIFNKVIRTPHDLASFVEWCKDAGIRNGLGSGVKKAIAGWLNEMSEYHAIKYPLNGKAYSLRDILRLVRPKPKNPRQHDLFHWVVDGTLSDAQAEGLPQVAAYCALKRHGDEKEVVQHTIRHGRLPHEVVTGTAKMDTETWREVMQQMPHFALLRNLNTLERHGVFDDQSSLDYVVDALTDEHAVLKSKVLPFRYYEANRAYVAAGGTHQDIADALATALEVSFQNMPELTSRSIIAVDVSGSMGQRLNAKSNVSISDIAALFGAALFKRSRRVNLMPFGSKIYPVRANRHDSIITTAKELGHRRDGTDLGSPLKEAKSKGIDFDVFIGVTDNEEWMSTRSPYIWGHRGSTSKGFYGEWVERKNKDARAYLVTVQTNRGYAPAPKDDPSVTLIHGWSPSVLQFIALNEAGMGTQVEHIRAIEA